MRAVGGLVVGVVETGGDGGAEEGEAAARAPARALLDAPGHEHLWALAGFDIGADHDHAVGAVGP